MNKYQIMAITIAVVISISTVICWYMAKDDIKTNSSKNVSKVETTDYEFTEDVKLYFAKADFITIQKVERTCIDNEDGSFEANYDSYIVSDIDFTKGEDFTQEYAQSLIEDGIDDSKVENLNFKDAFGFVYEDKDAWTLFSEVIRNNGIDMDTAKVDFDEELNQVTGQRVYVLKGKCTALENILAEINEDDVIEAKAFFQTVITDDEKEVPESMTVSVKYKDGASVVTKSIYFELVVNQWAS